MEKALARHEQGAKAPPPRGKPVRAEEYKAARMRRGNECIHCHQVNEFRRADAKAAGTWSRDDLWVYPLPENVGLTLELDRGDTIQSVRPGSPAAKVGIKARDIVEKLNGYSIASNADVQYALHKAPKSGTIPVKWRSGTNEMEGALAVTDGWRKTNLTWRSSLLDILPSLPISAEDLTAAEKKGLGIPESQAAFRQDKYVHSTLKTVGLQARDVVIKLDGKAVEGTMDDFLGLVRREHLVGDTITLTVLRDGKAVDLKVALK